MRAQSGTRTAADTCQSETALHRCHRCGEADHAVTGCNTEEPPTPSEKPEPPPQANDLGITDIDLSDTDSKLAQAEVFALSEGERNGQKPAIDILRAFASLPYADDGNLI